MPVSIAHPIQKGMKNEFKIQKDRPTDIQVHLNKLECRGKVHLLQ